MTHMTSHPQHCDHECYYKREILNDTCGIPRCQYDTRTTISSPETYGNINKVIGELEYSLSAGAQEEIDCHIREAIHLLKESSPATAPEKGCPFWHPHTNLYPDEPDNQIGRAHV